MAYTTQSFKNDGTRHGGANAKIYAKLAQLDAGILNPGSYTVAQTWPNDGMHDGFGPTTRAQLEKLCAALANGSASYTAFVWKNDHLSGDVGVEMIPKLNAMATEVARIRP